ncbi:hypothetical protein BT96DRAFT_317221 [Gymnopus androsaceus JB14]|uniref:Uncharacterized protein n=1 Tax=Gymnopus androsaceus JB14 TaxID=1447944 RepID=A0A6A4I7D9_9AGAR|nr:hypothetical protein BT96DRAFT_317221 [Gymnopus androsaceus JB14]
MLEFPEELLQALAEHIAFNIPFIERQIPTLRWKFQKSELIPLSMVNRQLRQICLPFLFAYVKVFGNEHAGKLTACCTANEAFAASIRSIQFGSFVITDTLLHLPCLPNLMQINSERRTTRNSLDHCCEFLPSPNLLH